MTGCPPRGCGMTSQSTPYTSAMTAGCSTSPGVPDATSRPPSRSRMRSQYAAARLRSCRAMIAVRPSSRTWLSRASWALTSRWLVGSSSSSRLGRCASARAICTRCCCPPLSVCQSRFARLLAPTIASASSATRRSSSPPKLPSTRERCGMRPSRTTSRTDRSMLGAAFCSSRAIRLAASRRDSAPTVNPSSTTPPVSGVSMPAMRRSRVDLPAPFGPSSPVTVPAGMTADTSLRIAVPAMENDNPSMITPTMPTSCA